MDRRLDEFLAQADSLSALFAALNDEVLSLIPWSFIFILKTLENVEKGDMLHKACTYAHARQTCIHAYTCADTHDHPNSVGAKN